MRPIVVIPVIACWLLLGAVPGTGVALAGFDPDAIYQVPSAGAPSTGNPQATVTIVEFSDYACGYCVRARATVAALKLLYPGQLRWVHRSVPFISGTTLGAEAAHAAAGQGHFEAMEALLYAAAGRYDRVAVEMLAQGLGLDMVRFRAELDSGAARQAIADDVALARRLGVTATPTFFINGRPILGSQAVATFVRVIDQELARAASVAGEPAAPGPTPPALVAPAALAAPAALYDRLVGGGLAHADEGPRQRPVLVELSPLHPYRIGTGLPGVQQGSPSAPVTLVVFSDFECAFCARNQAALLEVRRAFGDSLRVVFRHMPMPFHRHAQLAAEASMAAAAQGKFWEFHDRLFASPSGLTRADLEQTAQAAGLALDRFRADLDAHVYRDPIRLDTAGGMAIGVDGTPTMFLNGMMVSGAKAPADLVAAVAAQLDLSRRVMAAGVEPHDVYAVRMAGAEGHERSDPSTVPMARDAQALQLSELERLQVVTAACRRRVAVGATVAALPEPLAGYARQICAVYGVAR